MAQGHSGNEDIALHRLDASLAILVDDSRPTDSCSAPQGSRSTGPPYELDPEICAKLERLAAEVKELGIFHSYTRDDWGSTVYKLMLITKGVFALPMAAALWTRGVGRNGKDTCATSSRRSSEATR